MLPWEKKGVIFDVLDPKKRNEGSFATPPFYKQPFCRVFGTGVSRKEF